MDERIFRQLDRLQAGARVETLSKRDEYETSAEYSGYDRYDDGYASRREPPQLYQEPPMKMDSFDEELLRRTDQDYQYIAPAVPTRQEPVQNVGLARFAYNADQPSQLSSSPCHQPLHSSPTFNASQPRRLADAPPLRLLEHPPEGPQPSKYQPRETRLRDADARYPQKAPVFVAESFQPSYATSQPASKAKQRGTGVPIVQGISLVTTHELPDRFRAIFPFPLFNAVQSKCFDTIYKTNDNFVLSAPTGSGKTAVMELAICRLINGFANGSYKIVYQAPTKSLCAERQRDWQAKFGPLDLRCAELTGDTDNAQLRNVQHATIIVTTPEKWDSMTRKWKDHQKLMQMVKLFLIDEVHILKEDRGATLEAVVSRMKSVGSDVRFVTLSATVPNSQDIATWLGKNPTNESLPAQRERFGEEFRPVKLQKHVCGYQSSSNDFAFEKMLNSKLTDVIVKWSQKKPIMVFCFTRAACVETAKLLANWWATKGPRERHWDAPRSRVNVVEKDLRDTICSGVAFHHAGLQPQDRVAVEKGYLAGDLNVICCTSTLAVGVNLPCHMVIIKGTVTYGGIAGACKEYSDLEIMQMLGRAGRPQFDDSAVAVIMTRLTKVSHYEQMISGQEILESCLHRNLIDHLNAEIGLGTITNVSSAKHWLSGTFLSVRLKENPEHYTIEGDVPGRNLDERLENICTTAIGKLEDYELVKRSPNLHCTEFGDAMARYYLQFDTMKVFLALPQHAKVSEILSVISQAGEFKEVRFRAGEKPAYKDLNKNSSIKFPIPVNLDLPAHKVSLVIQSVLGAIELPTEDYKHKVEYTSAKAIIFQHATRLIRCIVDCQLYLDDAIATRNALMLARSIGAQVWDDSPLHMRQLEGVGIVYIRKLVAIGIKSIDDIESAETYRLESAVSRNPPFGANLQEKAKAFPKLRVSLKMMGEPIVKKGEHVAVKVKAEIGFLNERVPETFQKRAVYVCLLAETSGGTKIHFARISAKKLNKGQDVLFSATLVSANQSIRAYVMCDELAGTARHAVLKPNIPATAFPSPRTAERTNEQQSARAANTSKRRVSSTQAPTGHRNDDDEFGDAGIDDADLAAAAEEGFIDIDECDATGDTFGEPKQKKQRLSAVPQADDDWEPRQLSNGKWACNHACKDKNACKHLCCREGVDKKPKPPKPKTVPQVKEPKPDPKQTQLSVPSKKPGTQAALIEKPKQRKPAEPREVQDLNRIHNSVKTPTPRVPTLSRAGPTNTIPKKRTSAPPQADEEGSTDYGLDSLGPDDLPATNEPEPEPEDWDMLDDNDDRQGHMDLLSSYTGHGTPLPPQTPPRINNLSTAEARDQGKGKGKAKNGLFVHTSDTSAPQHRSEFSDLVATRLAIPPQPGIDTPAQREVLRGTSTADIEEEEDPLQRQPAGKEEEKEAGSEDEVERWFKAEFGTEEFEYVR